MESAQYLDTSTGSSLVARTEAGGLKRQSPEGTTMFVSHEESIDRRLFKPTEY